jgi:hypothetical protein
MFVSRISPATAKSVEALLGTNLSDYEIARRTATNRSTVQRWRTQGVPRRHASELVQDWRPSDPEAYSYLLGIYLGDGYLARGSRCTTLEIALDPCYPGIVEECAAAIRKILPVNVRIARRTTPTGEGIRIAATNPLWPLAFPQHGHGKKHERAIELETWQQDVVARFPQQFLRGLIHSDGSRVINRFTVELPTGGSREYAYARYFFTNLSADIRNLFCQSCDRLGVRWTQSSHKNISVAKRESVALLDSFIGSKH